MSEEKKTLMDIPLASRVREIANWNNFSADDIEATVFEIHELQERIERASVTELWLDYLNEIFKIDPVWTQKIFEMEAECNQELADHPDLIAWKNENGYSARFMGLLNGFLHRYFPRCRLISTHYKDDSMSENLRTGVMEGFGYTDGTKFKAKPFPPCQLQEVPEDKLIGDKRIEFKYQAEPQDKLCEPDMFNDFPRKPR